MMKRKFFAFGLVITAFVSVTTGCYVEYGHNYASGHYYKVTNKNVYVANKDIVR